MLTWDCRSRGALSALLRRRFGCTSPTTSIRPIRRPPSLDAQLRSTRTLRGGTAEAQNLKSLSRGQLSTKIRINLPVEGAVVCLDYFN